MADRSAIEWTDATWNPIRGCSRVSEGCRFCYAEIIAARFSGDEQPYAGLAERITRPDGTGEARWTGHLTIGHNYELPLRWRRPRKIFVNSMSDLFHEKLPMDEIATVYATCVAAHHLRGHTLQILTKRSARMREVLHDPEFWYQVNVEADAIVMDSTDPLDRRRGDARATLDDYGPANPPPGIWLGVSIEDQQRAEERVPDLLSTPAAIRFVSAEPLLGAIDLRHLDINGDCEIDALALQTPADIWKSHWDPAVTGTSLEDAIESFEEWAFSYPPSYRPLPRLDWVIAGGESGPNARPMHPDWSRSLRDQCAAAGVAFFFKQWGAWGPIDHSDAADEAGWLGRGTWMILSTDGSLDIPDYRWPDETIGEVAVIKVGKQAAGRLLDGVEHSAFPEAS